MYRFMIAGVAGAVLLGAVLVTQSETTSAGKPPVLVAGTSWSLTGKQQIKVRGVGKFKTKTGTATMYFGPLLAPLLAANEFQFETTSSTGTPIVIGGTYNQDNKGKIATNGNVADVEAAVQTLVEDLGTDNGLNVVVNSVVITNQKQKMKSKDKKGSPELKINVQLKSNVAGTIDGTSGDAKTKATYNMKGGQSPS